MKHRLLLAVALGLILAACGDSGTSPTAGSSPTTSPSAATGIAVTAVDFAFEPEQWTVAAGPGITVEFDNKGTLEHNWDVLSRAIDDEDELTDDIILWEISAGGGSRTTATISPDLAPGTYQIVCTIAGHFSAGMVGELTVTG